MVLNVGGIQYTSTRKTLGPISSFLKDAQEDTPMFIDRDGATFRHLLRCAGLPFDTTEFSDCLLNCYTRIPRTPWHPFSGQSAWSPSVLAAKLHRQCWTEITKWND